MIGEIGSTQEVVGAMSQERAASLVTPSLVTVRQFAERHPAFSIGSLRWLRFNEEHNGFSSVFVTVGRRVLINEGEFFRIVMDRGERERVRDDA